MREKLIAFVVFITFIYSSIAQYNDNFSDGNYTSNPTWGNGDFADFEVLNSKLHLNAVTIADRHLSIFSQAIENASWEFLVRMDFNPSSSNLSRVYLVSNNSNLASSLNGYYISLGGTDDEVSLFRQDGTTSTKIIDGVNKSDN